MIGYDQHAKIAALAAACGEHILLIGPPGTGKSQWATQFFAAYEGRVFCTQLSRWADETILFGPPNFRALRDRGELMYAQTGLLAAHWAYLDEIFDASDVLLRTLLGVLNERRFSRGACEIAVPLQAAIATANYTRGGELTEAVIDRFLFRLYAPSLTAGQRRALWDGAGHAPLAPAPAAAVKRPRISLEQLAAIRERAARLHIPQDVQQLGQRLAEQLAWSPRREARCAWAIKVHAAMHGREPTYDDLLVVIPALAPLTEDGPGQQAELHSQLTAEARRLRHEREQLERIQCLMAEARDAHQTPARSSEDDVHILRELVRTIQTVRTITPVSQGVEAEQNRVLQTLQQWHAERLHGLRVLP